MAEENKIESYFKEQWEAIGGEVRKVKWVGRSGAPDRFAAIAVWNGFIEFKAPGKKPKGRQAREIASLKALGVKVEVIDSYEKVNRHISNVKRCMAYAAIKGDER